MSFDASEDTTNNDSSKGRISSFSSSHGSIESTVEETTVDYTIPEETDDDIKDISEKVENVDVQNRSENCEGRSTNLTQNYPHIFNAIS